MKNNVKPVIVLTLICLVVAGLLSVTNFYTAPVIEANKAAAATGSLTEVMPEATGFTELEVTADMPATVKQIYQENSGLGYVVIIGTISQYSSGEMGITVAIGTDGKISGVTLTSYQESKDFGKDTYPQTYIGVDSSLNVDTFSGVTYSSTAFKQAIGDAFTALLSLGTIAEGQKSEEQLIAETMPLALPGAANSLGNAIMSDPYDCAAGTRYDSTNGVGSIVIVNDGATYIVAVNAFGQAVAYDLEGNVADFDVSSVASEVGSSFNADEYTDTIKNRLGDDSLELTPVTDVKTFNTVAAAYTGTYEGNNAYFFICKSLAYGDEEMDFLTVIAEDGTVLYWKSLGEMVLHSEYYSAYEIPEGYSDSFLGLTESTYSDDVTVISGATFTANAVGNSLRDSFATFNSIKEGN